jgi:GNAT acetyltransferase
MHGGRPTNGSVERYNDTHYRAIPRGWATSLRPNQVREEMLCARSNVTAFDTEPDRRCVAPDTGRVGVRGPALLFYGYDLETFGTGRVVGPLPGENALVQEVAIDATKEERDESGIEDCTSGFYVALNNESRPAAICGWREWPCRVAHMSVLTASSQRGHGHAASTSARALQAATQEGLLPQWRAAHWNLASIGLARRLGLAEVVQQFSVHVI